MLTQRDFTPNNNNRRQRDVTISKSISSMERALRTLTSPSSPVTPQTPRRNDVGMNSTKTKSFRSMKPTITTARNGNSSSNGGEEAVKVAIRVRPLAPGGDQCAGRAWKAQTNNNSIVETTHRANESSNYSYDKVFGETSNTCEIYNGLVSDIVESVIKEGVNGTVFTYGQTSSGKTFTMQGTSANNDSSIGVIQLAAKDIFESIKEEKSDNPNSTFTVKVSYVEIYNEELRDLLNDNKRRKSSVSSLLIREDKRGVISVEGLKEVAVRSLDQLMDVFKVGELNKSVGSTKMNERSSRSHAILSINLEKKTVLKNDMDEDKENTAAGRNELVVKTTSSLNLVDLAGSESVKHTGASGMQKKEGGMINQSLLTLSKVLMSLGQKNPGHISYRDSKLTRILKSSLSGNARMAVICCITPSGKYIEETRSTLQFATRAKLVKTNALKNEEQVQDGDLIAKYRLEAAKAKWENKKLEDRLRKVEDVNSNALTTERELTNLKKFMFSEKSKTVMSNTKVSKVQPKRLRFSTASFDDEQVVATTSPLVKLESDKYLSKDDTYVHHTRTDDDDNSLSEENTLLRTALEEKAKQVRQLMTEEKKVLTAREKRMSLITEDRNKDRRESLRLSLIGAVQSTSTDDDEKLINANNLIESLESQIDELIQQKNEALDWIEDLFVKEDHTDEKLKQLTKEKDDAVKNCSELDNELLKHEKLLANASSEIEELRSEAKDTSNSKVEELQLELETVKEKYEVSQDSLRQVQIENRQLLHDKRTVDFKVDELEAELKYSSRGTKAPDDIAASELGLIKELKVKVHELEDMTSEYNQEKMALVDQIELYEQELNQADGLLKEKSDELEDALFSLDKERRSWLNERNEHIDKIQSMSNLLSLKEEELKANASNNDQTSEVAELRLENERLANECTVSVQKNDTLSDELNETRRQRDNAKLASREVDDLRVERSRLLAERQQYTKDVDDCCSKMEDLSNELSRIQRELQDSKGREDKMHQRCAVLDKENRELAESLNVANAKVKELFGKYTLEEKSKAQLRSSVYRIQELVDVLSAENTELKEKDGLLERESRELQHLLTTTTTERDDLIKSNKSLSSKFKDVCLERDSAIREKEIVSTKLVTIAADFEADYETVRSKVDILLDEKQELQDKVTFLQASKTSIEDNADRILKHDNGLGIRHDRLKTEFKTQSIKMSELEDEVKQLIKRLRGLKSINEHLSNDNRELRNDIRARVAAEPRANSGDGNNKRRVIFGLRI